MDFKARFLSEYEEDINDDDSDDGTDDEGEDDEVHDNPKENKATNSPAGSRHPKKKSRTALLSSDSEAGVMDKNKAETAKASNNTKTKKTPQPRGKKVSQEDVD